MFLWFSGGRPPAFFYRPAHNIFCVLQAHEGVAWVHVERPEALLQLSVSVDSVVESLRIEQLSLLLWLGIGACAIRRDMSLSVTIWQPSVPIHARRALPQSRFLASPVLDFASCFVYFMNCCCWQFVCPCLFRKTGFKLTSNRGPNATAETAISEGIN